MAIYRGPGGAGDATGDATNASALALAAKDAAETAATSAASSATAASNSATAADTSADEAATSATNASGSASTASTAATNAGTYASNASDSADEAAASASDADDSATAAASSASAASTSETNAASSASAASTSASNASTSATNASNSASDAATSASEAAASAVTAATFDPALYLAKSGNLSGLANTATARDNLGVEIGVDVQAFNAALAAIAANNGTNMMKNRIINGNMAIAQRATSVTVTTGTTVPTASTGYPCVDRFFVYSTGANVTAAQVAGSGATQYRLQITGAASVTAVGVGQRIEQLNSYDMAGSTATLSVDLANSLLTTVTWTANYATTANTFGTIGTPTKTQIATGTFTVSSTVTNFSTQISIPAAATTGIEILFTVGAQTSGTFTVGQVQLEKGSTATSFDYRPYGTELALCQGYYETGSLKVYIGGATSAGLACSSIFKATKRASPTMTYGTAGSRSYVPTSNEWVETDSFCVFRSSGNEIACTWTAASEL